MNAETLMQQIKFEAEYHRGVTDGLARVMHILEEVAMPAGPFPKLKEKPAEKTLSAKDVKDFLVACVTPEGDIYQLESISRVNGERGHKGFAVYKIMPDGKKEIQNGTGFPPVQHTRVEAISAFCGWSKEKGFEIKGGSPFSDIAVPEGGPRDA